MQTMNYSKQVTKIRILLFVAALLLGPLFANSAWAQSDFGSAYDKGYGQSLTNIPQPGTWLADGDGDFRSKADVLREVKRRYEARVLKISLNKKREVYQVRLLMPNGKVRNISVSARR